jgi:KDO2-lipid IV(A) lauroyltransferase
MSKEPSSEVLPGRAHRHRFEGPFYRRIMLGGIRRIPPRLKRLSMPFWAGIFYSLLPSARRAVESNLEHVFAAGGDEPGSQAPSRWGRHERSFRLFCNYAQMLSDTYGMHMGLPFEYETATVGYEHVAAAVRRGKGVLAATGHLGMWQLAPFLVKLRGLARFCVAMAEEPNRAVQEFEQRFRDRLEIVYTTGSPFASLRLAQVLREGAILGMQIDRNIGGQVIELPFFGKRVAFPAGPAMLARLTGASIVPNFFMLEEDDSSRRVVHYIEPQIEVAHTRERERDVYEATAAVVAVYERFVRRYPTQWYHFYDFFAPPPNPTQEAARPSAGGTA